MRLTSREDEEQRKRRRRSKSHVPHSMYSWRRGRLSSIVSLCLPWDAKLLNEGRQLRWAGKERLGVPSLSSSEIPPIFTGINVMKEVFGNVTSARCLEERRSLLLTKLHLKGAIKEMSKRRKRWHQIELIGIVGSRIMGTETKRRKVQEK
ncbi:hypothetical protein WUBG_13706 [Wuchereria bancrofti]|uniref:Uncharacterized protein n=1 Tax=Wuchereria bancrofti TaxID=6293 RepID=J9EED4_WUCBA|nr:hypothetical protein WUBG_13706 [Wuchereria bancrofti]